MTIFNRRPVKSWRTLYTKAPLVMAMWALHCNVPLHAQDFTPTTTADGVGNGSLRDAVIAVNGSLTDDRILLSAGTYTLSVTGRNQGTTAGDLNIFRSSGYGSVTILGAGAGTTIIDAAQIDRAFSIPYGAKVTFKNLTIRNGLANDNGTGFTGPAAGGAIFSYGGSGANVTLDSVVIENCAATAVGLTGYFAQGGAVSMNGGTLTILNSTIRNNTATAGTGLLGFTSLGSGGAGGAGGTAQGGGIFGGAGTTISISGSTINNNVATGGTGGAGGVATGYGFGGTGGFGGAAVGGGVYLTAFFAGTNTLDILNSTVSSNTANPGTGGAGGSGVTGGGNGGGTSLFSSGGGVAFDAGVSGSIKNSTVAFNKVNDAVGGAGGTGAVNGTAGTSQPGAGGGVAVNPITADFVPAVFLPPPQAVNVLSTIISNNVASVGPDEKGLAITSQGFNLISNSTGSSGFTQSTDITNADPLLSALANNGGPTQTLALKTGSPAIDKGNVNSLSFDQRGTGYPRVVGSAADIGAFEYTPPPPTPPSNPPVITSGPTANPTNPIVNQVVTFSVGGTGNFTWDYGDGSTGSGTTATHQYAIPGVYTVTVTETDPNTGLTTTATLTITVHGTPFRVSRATIKLSPGHDKANIVGVLHIPANTSLSGQKLLLTLGTNSITFTLDSHGRGKSGGSSIKVRQNGKSSQEGTFTAVITGDLLAGLKANMPLDSQGLPTEITVGAQFVGGYYTANNKPEPDFQYAITVKFKNNIAKFNILAPIHAK